VDNVEKVVGQYQFCTYPGGGRGVFSFEGFGFYERYVELTILDAAAPMHPGTVTGMATIGERPMRVFKAIQYSQLCARIMLDPQRNGFKVDIVDKSQWRTVLRLVEQTVVDVYGLSKVEYYSPILSRRTRQHGLWQRLVRLWESRFQPSPAQ